MSTPESNEPLSPIEPELLESDGFFARAWRRLGEGLGPYVAEQTGHHSLRESRNVYDILEAMENNWNLRFRSLGRIARSHLVILRTVRNPWAHQGEYSDEDVLHYLRTIEKLLRSVSATDLANQVLGFYVDLAERLYGDSRGREPRNWEPLDDSRHQEGDESLRGLRRRRAKSGTNEERDLEERANAGGGDADESQTPISNGDAGIVEEFLALGRAAKQEGKIDVAGIYFDVVRRLGPEVEFEAEDAAIYVARGRVHAQQGNQSSAIFDYEIALEINPDLSIGREFGAALDGRAQLLSALPGLGYCGEQYYGQSAQSDVSEDDHRRALADYTEALKWDPENARAYYHNRGQVRFAIGEYDQAAEDFSLSLDSDKGEGDAYYNRGDAFYNRGQVHFVIKRYELATADFESADSTPRANRARGAPRSTFSHDGKARIRTIARCSALLGLHSRNAEVLLERGQAYVRIGKHEMGMADFERARRVDSTRAAEAFLLRGRSYHAQSNYDQAISDFDESVLLDSDIEVDFDYAETYGKRGLTRFKTGNYELALSDFNSVLKHIPDHAGAYYDRGRANIARRDYPEAIADFKETLRILADEDAHYDEEGDFDLLDRDEESYLDDFPEEYQVRFELGRAYSGARRYEDSIDAFSQAHNEIENAHDVMQYHDIMQYDYGVSIFNSRGNAYFRLKDYQRAIEDYSSAMEWGQSSRNPVLWRNRGLALFHSRQFADAVEDFDVYLRYKPDDELILSCRIDAVSHLDAEAEFSVRDSTNSASWYDRGCHYADTGDYQQALSDFTEALSRHLVASGLQTDGDSDLLSRLDEARSGSSEDCSVLEQLKIQISDHTDILLARAEAHSSLGQNALAWQDLERIIRLRPDFAPAWYRRGRIKQQGESYIEAIPEYDKAIVLNGNYAAAYYSRGLCHYHMGNTDQARSDIDTAYERGFES